MKLYDLHSIPFEFELGGVLGFATMTALGAYDDAAVADGGLVWVASFRDYCQKIVESPAPAAVDAMVVPTASGDGGWYRLGIASPSWKSQAAWYIDPAGDDEDEGSLASPLATFAEFARRLPVLSQSTTVTLLDDTTEVFTGHFTVEPGTDAIVLSIHGDPEVMVTGTVDVVAAPNPASATNLPGTLTALDGALAAIDWNALGDGTDKHFVEVTGGARVGYTTAIIYSTGGTTAYTPEWTYNDTFVIPLANDPIRVLAGRTLPTMKIVAEGIVVACKYLHFTDITTSTSVVAQPFRWDGATLEASRFEACRFDCAIDATGTWLTKLQACVCDADAGTFSVMGTGGHVRLIGTGVDGDLGHSSAIALMFDGAIIMVGSLAVTGPQSSDGMTLRPQVLVGPQGLGIFGVALSSTGLTVTNADVRVNGALFGKTHLRGLYVTQGAAVSIKSTLTNATTLTLTGTTELSMSTPNGIGAGLVVPIVAGIPTGAGAAIATWANWVTLNKQAINFGDLTRIVGLA